MSCDKSLTDYNTKECYKSYSDRRVLFEYPTFNLVTAFPVQGKFMGLEVRGVNDREGYFLDVFHKCFN